MFRLQWLTILLCITLAGCSESATNPTDKDLLNALRVGDEIAMDAKLLDCQPGTLNQREVVACSGFAHAVSFGKNVSGAIVSVDNTTDCWKMTLARAVSRDQPEITPRGNAGVWVVLGRMTGNRQSTKQTPDQFASNLAKLPEVAARGLSVEVSPANFGFGPPALSFMRGSEAVPTSVFARELENVLEERRSRASASEQAIRLAALSEQAALCAARI